MEQLPETRPVGRASRSHYGNFKLNCMSSPAAKLSGRIRTEQLADRDEQKFSELARSFAEDTTRRWCGAGGPGASAAARLAARFVGVDVMKQAISTAHLLGRAG